MAVEDKKRPDDAAPRALPDPAMLIRHFDVLFLLIQNTINNNSSITIVVIIIIIMRIRTML